MLFFTLFTLLFVFFNFLSVNKTLLLDAGHPRQSLFLILFNLLSFTFLVALCFLIFPKQPYGQIIIELFSSLLKFKLDTILSFSYFSLFFYFFNIPVLIIFILQNSSSSTLNESLKTKVMLKVFILQCFAAHLIFNEQLHIHNILILKFLILLSILSFSYLRKVIQMPEFFIVILSETLLDLVLCVSSIDSNLLIFFSVLNKLLYSFKVINIYIIIIKVKLMLKQFEHNEK
jgi:hypothetical protein